MKVLTTLFASLIFAGHLIPVDAKQPEPLSDCVSLSEAHEGTRFGSQYLLLKDGDEHYRVGFGGSCDAIARSSLIKVSTGKQPNRLCPRGSSVSSRAGYCSVRSVETIDAEDYQRQARRNRR